MKSAPSSPAELVSALAEIFPNFVVELDAEDDGELTYHAVFLFHFNPFFGKHVGEFTPKQLRAFGQLLAECQSVSGGLPNAVDTCFLEHTRQMKVNRQLQPYLKEPHGESKR